ncbi:hypothetical protein EDD18DRAFT_1105738 [Armillaria luteobubalina]|uniref:Uncharacterized protein n=1 Tax=Armillaria luteobubalina TaxID=153913 RepID=A0AA39Q427_9AGAR|nr:hypothetical protein EDD18DRAFT_1105738 [Armillaria luteobubalina]
MVIEAGDASHKLGGRKVSGRGVLGTHATRIGDQREFVKVLVPEGEGDGEREGIAEPALAAPYNISRQATLCLPMYDIQTKVLCFVKDSWRDVNLPASGESNILQTLRVDKAKEDIHEHGRFLHLFTRYGVRFFTVTCSAEPVNNRSVSNLKAKDPRKRSTAACHRIVGTVFLAEGNLRDTARLESPRSDLTTLFRADRGKVPEDIFGFFTHSFAQYEVRFFTVTRSASQLQDQGQLSDHPSNQGKDNARQNKHSMVDFWNSTWHQSFA